MSVTDDRIRPVRVHRAHEAKVEEKAERGDERQRPVVLPRETSLHGERELRSWLERRTRDELEEERRIADDDLAASFIAQRHLPRAVDVRDPTREGDAPL